MNCSLSASSSGESGAELMDDKELSSSNDVEGMDEAVTEDVGPLYCRSGNWSLSLEASTRCVKSPAPSLSVTSIASGTLNLLDLVAFGVCPLPESATGTINSRGAGPLVGVASLEGGISGCLNRSRWNSCGDL